MTKHSGATHAGNGSAECARRPATGRDPRVSERIYDYISAGRPDQRDRGEARPALPSARS